MCQAQVTWPPAPGCLAVCEAAGVPVYLLCPSLREVLCAVDAGAGSLCCSPAPNLLAPEAYWDGCPLG